MEKTDSDIAISRTLMKIDDKGNGHSYLRKMIIKA